ncbi:MAG: epoxyqueuosine reductase QueH [Synergistaceae bacterium]|nr:epoxyqueuosine reductase QueH [Synergistaceae bacterium]
MLHICCAPDATVPWTELSLIENLNLVGYFYGSNIHPPEEYDKRRNAVEILMDSVKGQCIFPAPTPLSWLDSVRALADEPEGGKRCALCFRLQLDCTARAAVNSGCSHMCTTLTISPHKDVALINSIGNEITENYGLTWVERIWRKNNGFQNSVRMSKAIGLYRQNYCGCKYSKERQGLGIRD